MSCFQEQVVCHPIPWFNEQRGLGNAFFCNNSFGPHQPIFWTEHDVKHDKRRCSVSGRFNRDGVARGEWHWQSVRRDKNKSLDCHFKIAVLPQCTCGRTGTNKRPRHSQRTVLLCALKSARRRSDPCYRRRRRRHEETPQIETVGGNLKVWRDQRTNEIIIEPPVFAQTKKRCGSSHSQRGTRVTWQVRSSCSLPKRNRVRPSPQRSLTFRSRRTQRAISRSLTADSANVSRLQIETIVGRGVRPTQSRATA